MSDFLQSVLTDLLFMLVPFFLALMLSLFSFLLERLHPDISATTKTYRSELMKHMITLLKQTAQLPNTQTTNTQTSDHSVDSITSYIISSIASSVASSLQQSLQKEVLPFLEDKLKDTCKSVVQDVLETVLPSVIENDYKNTFNEK